MKRLNQTWQNQKSNPSKEISQNGLPPIKDGNVPIVTSRRRLGRFPLVTRTTMHTKKTENIEDPASVASREEGKGDGKFPSSFISSGCLNADNDLLAEMDRVEATLKNDINDKVFPKTSLISAKSSKICDQNPIESIDGKDSRNFREQNKSTGAAVNNDKISHKRKVQKSNASNEQAISPTGRERNLNLRSISATRGKLTLKMNSPTSSPINKVPRLNCKARQSKEVATEDGKEVESKIKLSSRGDNDISFSPLLETPLISSDSSDGEKDGSINSKRHKSKSLSVNRQDSVKSRQKVPLNVVETPKRSSTRKRHSPKTLISPAVKLSKLKEKINDITDGVPKLAPFPKSGFSTSSLDGLDKRESSNECKILTEIDSQRYATNSTGLSVGSSTACGNEWTQIRRKSVSPGQSSVMSPNLPSNMTLTEDKLLLKSWSLPEPVLVAYEKQGVTSMFEWQAECLLSPSVLEGGNLIYSAPTSAGKTLVAEILVLKRVLETKKKALFILPFVSVAREKMFSLQRLLQDAGIRVGGYMGSHAPSGGFSALDVAICTIEKGNGLVNRMMEDGRIDDVGVVVVDELHMVGDSHRGYLLELMLTKLQFLSQRQESHHRLQVIGMSATLPNLEILAQWLTAALYRTDFRPVPLAEHIKVDNKILDGQLVIQGEVPSRFISPEDSDHVIALCLETVTEGHSVLVFCPTKNWCEKLCETIARKFYQITHSQQSAEDKEKATEQPGLLSLNKAGLMESIQQLQRCPVGVDPMLGRCLVNGVAYHHAGLTFDERDIIEGAFREGHLRVLVATSTLSSGVNLPARRVIIRTPMFHGQVIDTLTFKQMCGRAGRKGVDVEGESVLICKPSEKLKGKKLLQAELPPVESCLYFDADNGLSRSLKRAILEVVVSGVTPRPEDVMSYIKCTLLSASIVGAGEAEDTSDLSTSALIEKCTTFLQDNEFVSTQIVKKEDGTEYKKFFPTQLGSAILASSLSPDEGLLVFAELQKARRSFVLESELHVVYLVTPIYTSDIAASIDWYQYYTLWENLSPAERRVADLIGVSEGFIAQAIGGRINKKTEAQRKTVAVHHRFYTALVLNTLVHEVPLMEVAAKFNLNKGQLQSLQQSAATYSGMVTVFCQRLGWHNLELILSRFQGRLSKGVQHELVDLVRISALTASSARMLYNAGFLSVADVARAEAVEVEELFKTAVPFQSDKKQDGETAWEQQERQKTKCIWLTGRKGMTELDAAHEIIAEAKAIVQGDLGVRDIAWSSKDSDADETRDERSCDDTNEEERDGTNEGHGGYESEKENSKECYKTEEVAESISEKQGTSTRIFLHENKDVVLEESSFTKIKEKPSKSKMSPSSIALRDKSFARKDVSHDTENEVRTKDEKIVSESHPKNKSINVSTCTQGGNQERDITLSGLGTKMNWRSSCFLNKSKVKSSKGKRKSCVSNQTKRNDSSFFGQVVVTPPPGLHPLPSVSNFRLASEREPIADENEICVMRNEQRCSSRDNSCTSDRNTLSSEHSCTERSPKDRKVKSCNSCTSDRNTLSSEHSCTERSPKDRKVKSCNSCTTDRNTLSSEHSCTERSPKDRKVKSWPTRPRQISESYTSLESKHPAILSIPAPKMDEKEEDVDEENFTSTGLRGHHCSTRKPISSCKDRKDETSCSSSLLREGKRIEKPVMEDQMEDSVSSSENPGRVSLDMICSSENQSNISEDFSFSDSFILDTQTSNLINAGCQGGDGENIFPVNEMPHSSKHRNIFSTQHVHKSSKKLSSSIAKLSAQSRREINSKLSDIYSEEQLNNDKAKNNEVKHLSLNHGDLEASADHYVVDDENYDVVSENDGNGGVVDDDNDSESKEDLPCSLLAASCYEGAANFDDGMIECSGLEDSLDSSLSELNDVRGKVSSHRPRRRSSLMPKCSGAITQSGMPCSDPSSSDAFNNHPHGLNNNGISYTQYTDDSLLAAVNLDNMNSQTSYKPQDLNSAVKANADAAANVSPPNLSCSLSMCDSLSASLVDQAFAQCQGIETSSPRDILARKCKMSLHKSGHHQTSPSLQTTPNMRVKKDRAILNNRLDISPVVCENIESNQSSLNNSSINDGSDCVPPTPPDETSSIASPLKLALMSPMRIRNRSDLLKNKGIKEYNPTCKSGNEKADYHTIQEPRTPNYKANKAKTVPINTPVHEGEKVCSNSEVGNKRLLDCRHKTLDSVSKYPKGSETDIGAIPVSQAQAFTQQSFTVIDVCAHEDLFNIFLSEWETKSSFSIALACEKLPATQKRTPTGIGNRFTKRRSCASPLVASPSKGLPLPGSGTQLVGVAVAWEHRDAYFVSLISDGDGAESACGIDDSLAEPSLCESLTLSRRIEAIRTRLHRAASSEHESIQIYDAKLAYTTLAKLLGVGLRRCQDPRVADWLREPGARLKNLHRMVTTYLPDELFLLHEVGGSSSYQGLGFEVKSRVSGRVRACTESILTRKLMAEYERLLHEHQLWQAFVNTEMPALVTLARMELNGFGLNMSELEAQKLLMTSRLASLEQQAYKMAGHVFSLTSVDDIAKVLYLELKLPLNGDLKAAPHLSSRGTRNRRTTVGGTSKDILEKLQRFHALPAVILEWRRISSALTKSLFTLQRAAQDCERLNMMRVFSDCQVFSATGRVSMAEPNVQNIPKDFNMEGHFHDTDTPHGVQPISLRKMFIPFRGGVILSADYSQLELRIIAHLSCDNKLIRILNRQGGDVFKLIAAQLKTIDLDEVSAADRQQAKQVCYGMLYGIGPKALGEQIGVTEEDASVFMETFKSTYPGIRKYLRETVEFCQKNGYVKTLYNRRRYLPAIKHTNPHARAQAERQAVNSSVQGSAADLVKKAMTNIDLRLMHMFPDTHTPHRHSRAELIGTGQSNHSSHETPQGAFFLLQLHDELIYEVSMAHLHAVAQVIKIEMESAAELCVQMPVKVNVGPSWGQLEEYSPKTT